MELERIKRGIRNRAGNIFAFRLLNKTKIGLIFEEVHLKKFFKHYNVDCVFDVGANHGQYATMIRKRVGYKGPIISFEPIPAAAAVLRKKAKSDPNWYVEELALDKSVGTAIFNIMLADQFSSLHAPSEKEVDLFKVENKVAKQISVATSTLKDVFEKYQKLLNFKRPFLKMDTQGHDLEIAQGGGLVLKSFVGLQSELSIRKIYDDTNDYTKVIAYYQSQGFELSAFIPNNEGHFPHLIEIDCVMYNKNLSS
jgi:FkbM family methyltransferase